ncbi:hypothetical protein ACJX0J_019483 [Zea mays]
MLTVACENMQDGLKSKGLLFGFLAFVFRQGQHTCLETQSSGAILKSGLIDAASTMPNRDCSWHKHGKNKGIWNTFIDILSEYYVRYFFNANYLNYITCLDMIRKCCLLILTREKFIDYNHYLRIILMMGYIKNLDGVGFTLYDELAIEMQETSALYAYVIEINLVYKILHNLLLMARCSTNGIKCVYTCLNHVPTNEGLM